MTTHVSTGMDIITYDVLTHYRSVAELWERALGATYPVCDRVLWPRIAARPTYEPGDGVVAMVGERVVGFGMVEIDRAPLSPGRPEALQALIVDPDYQRRGLGSALLARLDARLRAAGCSEVIASGGLYRFWTGIPEDLPAVRAFFVKHGYEARYEAIDTFGSLDGYAMAAENRDALAAQGAEITSMTPEQFGGVYSFLTRELPGWRSSMLAMVNAGDAANVLVVTHGDDVIGCIQTFPPDCRFRSANLAWERTYGARMGGFGAVLIAEAWRGRGLGVAMIHAAAQYIKDRGATGCYIDWTSHALAPFYARVGTAICKTFGMYGKTLTTA